MWLVVGGWWLVVRGSWVVGRGWLLLPDAEREAYRQEEHEREQDDHLGRGIFTGQISNFISIN